GGARGGGSARGGRLGEGGYSDAPPSRGAPPEIKLVALYSGIVKLDADGHATVHLDIPDYNGRLRLMAVAWDSEKVGAGEAGLVGGGPTVGTPAPPRLLAPGHQSHSTRSPPKLSPPAPA